MTQLLHIPALIAIHLVLGKKASFPYGLVFGFNTWLIAILVIITDFAEIPFYRWLIAGAFDKIKPLQWLHGKLDHRESAFSQKRLYRWFIHAGALGVFILVIIPGAGGVQTGTLLSHILHLSKSRANVALGIGSIIGCLVFVAGAEGIMALLGL